MEKNIIQVIELKKSFSAKKINIQITFKKTCYYLAAYNRAVHKIH